MINTLERVTDNYKIEGFEPALKGSELSFTSGSFIGNEATSFEAFAFDIKPSTDSNVIYDVYLLENGTVHIDRTERDMAFYEGTDPMLYTLSSFTVKPTDTDYNIIVYRAVRENEEA